MRALSLWRPILLPAAALTIMSLPTATEAQRPRPAVKSAPKAAPKAIPKASPTASATMPVAPGFWVDESENCASVRSLNFYDGRRWGNLRAEGGQIYGSSGQPILRSAAGKNGYTNIWFEQNTNVNGDLSIRSLGPTRYMTRHISYGSGHVGGRVEVDEYISKKCEFAHLPPLMRTAIQRHAPQMVPGATAARPAPLPPAPLPGKAPAIAAPAAIGPLGIRPGHYINPNKGCNQDGGEIFYYDGRRWGWLDLSGYAANRLDPVTGIRKAGNRWNLGYGEMLRVDAVDRVFIASDTIGNVPLRWCAPGSVRANARAR